MGQTRYEQVSAYLYSRIAAGDYPVGEKIPTENELASLLGVSRPTVRQALEEAVGKDHVLYASGCEIKRPLEIPEEGLPRGLVLNIPDSDVDDWDDCESYEGEMAFAFGQAPAAVFLKNFDFDVIVAGLLVVPSGYDFPFMPDQTVVTVFSASNYALEYDNRGAILNIDENLHCSFELFEPIDYPREE